MAYVLAGAGHHVLGFVCCWTRLVSALCVVRFPCYLHCRGFSANACSQLCLTATSLQPVNANPSEAYLPMPLALFKQVCAPCCAPDLQPRGTATPRRASDTSSCSSGWFVCCSGHQSFSSNKRINDLVGNITHSSILVPYHGWRISHRTHHSNHGHVENDESWHPVSKKLYDSMVRETDISSWSALHNPLLPVQTLQQWKKLTLALYDLRGSNAAVTQSHLSRSCIIASLLHQALMQTVSARVC